MYALFAMALASVFIMDPKYCPECGKRGIKRMLIGGTYCYSCGYDEMAIK